MSITTTKRVAIIGAGTMGHSIAAVAATAGYSVSLTDAFVETLPVAQKHIISIFDASVRREKLTVEQREAALALITTVDSVAECVAKADIVIEAIPEELALKQALFNAIDIAAPAHALLATNTSSLSVTAIATAVAAPERLIGMHFFNPVIAMKLVELVRGRATADETVAEGRAFAESLGKTAIIVNDTPGFATSRLGVVLGLEAIRMLEQGVASAEDIDRAMELGYNHPVGPLKLTDIVGLDVRLAIADHLHTQLHDDTYVAPALLRRMVAEGKLGKKSGTGFYQWK